MQKNNLEEFLIDAAARDQQPRFARNYVFPKTDVGERITQEIATRIGREPAASLEDCPAVLSPNWFFSARPEQFMERVMVAINEVVRLLKREKVRTFFLTFNNPGEVLDPRIPHCWGDEVRMMVHLAK